jgi:UDP-glucose 4-epimerase
MGRYLVTGGAGFIGSHLVDSLVRDGHTVRVLDDLSTGRADNLPSGAELVISSVTDPSDVRHALDGVDGCFHLAAIASVERCHREWLRSHAVNLSGTITVFDEVQRLRNCGMSVPVVYASSAAVYGDQGDVPLGEESHLRPINAYGADKLGCELHAAVAWKVHRIPTVGLRFFNVYGPRQDPNSPYSGVISIFLQKLTKGDDIQIHGDGGQVRDFIYVDDVIRALRLSMNSKITTDNVFNVCTGKGTTICQLADTIARACSVQSDPRYLPPRVGDLRQSIGDPNKAETGLGFRARISLSDGLTKTLQSVADSPIDPTGSTIL